MAGSDVSSDDLGTLEDELGSWSEESSGGLHHSHSLLVLLEGESVSSSSPGLDGSEAEVPADSLSELAELVDSASSSVLLEVLDGSGVFPLADPGASGPLVLTSLESSAGLALSVPLSHESSSHLLAPALVELGSSS